MSRPEATGMLTLSDLLEPIDDPSAGASVESSDDFSSSSSDDDDTPTTLGFEFVFWFL